MRLLSTCLTEFSVVLVGDQRMSNLHLRFMNIAGPTDVLTFPIDEDSRGRPTAGEVYVCVPEAHRQSHALATPLRSELLLYALHGLLHLSGFDDRTESQYRRMHRTEDDILSRLGIGRVFAPNPVKPVAAKARNSLPSSAVLPEVSTSGRVPGTNRPVRGDRPR